METAPGVPTGVKELIARLRDEGVKAGKKEADRLIQEAWKEAQQVMKEARTEARELREQSHKEIEAERTAAKEAIHMAFRDTELKVKSELKSAFEQHVRRLVTAELEDKDVLKGLILQIAGRVAPIIEPDQAMEISISKKWSEAQGESDAFTQEGKDYLGKAILGITRDMLREGVDLVSAEEQEVGLHVKLVGKDVEIDLSDKVLSDLLLKFLTPRYRAIVAGAE